MTHTSKGIRLRPPHGVREAHTISIAESPEALAAITICDRTYRSSRREGDLITDVSAQSAQLMVNANQKDRSIGSYNLQPRTENIRLCARRTMIHTRSASSSPPRCAPNCDFHSAISLRFHTERALSILATMRRGNEEVELL